MHNCIPNIYLYGQYIFHAQHLFAQETDSQIVKKLTGINCQSREGILAETGGHNANDDNSEWSINQNTISTVHGYGILTQPGGNNTNQDNSEWSFDNNTVTGTDLLDGLLIQATNPSTGGGVIKLSLIDNFSAPYPIQLIFSGVSYELIHNYGNNPPPSF